MPTANSVMHQAQLSFQVCPIILTGGSVAQVPGGILPLLSVFYSSGSALFLPDDINDLDDAFGAFNVLPGGTLVSQTIGKYPFANQYVAANAVIKEPLTISVIMDAPMRPPHPLNRNEGHTNLWDYKQSMMTNLKGILDNHNDSGGTYTVLTPAYAYQNLVLVSLTDNSRGNSPLPQNAWRFDFERPLVALADLAGAQNQLMQKLTNQVLTPGTQTGQQPGSSTANVALTGDTPRVAGALSGGNTSVLFQPTPALNFPALAQPPGFQFIGVS